MNVNKYSRKSFPVEAIQVTPANMQEIAKWCGGVIFVEGESSYIKVEVHNPMNERQTQAYSGDWVLYSGKGYKVYKDSAFRKSFDEQKPPALIGNVFDQDEIRANQGMAENPGGTHTV